MNPVISRLPYTAEHLDALLAFCRDHGTTGHPPDLLRRLLGQLPADASAVLDVARDGRRALVAVVLDTLDNCDDAAVVDVLGWTGTGDTTAFWPWVLDQAEGRVRAGVRRTVSIGLPPRLADLGPWLTQRGYRLAYTMFSMATPDLAPPAVTDLPAGWHWETLDPTTVRAYYDAVVAAMAPVPGTNIAAYADFAPMALQAPILPRLLYDGTTVAGFYRVSLSGEAADIGYVSAIGRSPAYRGRQVGERLLTTAMATLATQGARRFALDVAATNARALALYERHGFRLVSQQPHYLRDLDP